MADNEDINEADTGDTQDEGSNGDSGDGQARARRLLTDIAPRSWEHPADRAALQALRKIPVFDEVMRTLFGYFGEKPIRLSFQANAVRVTPRQYSRIHGLYESVLETLDAPDHYPLYVSQTPIVNAGAYGMLEPFIILNSGTVSLLNDDQLSYVLGHEIGHVMSDHVLYRTMTALLIQLAGIGFPIVGLAARVVLVGLLEWQRKSELSSDRAGLLSTQDPEMVMGTMLKMAGGGNDDELNLDEFIQQAEDYRESGDVADQVFKILNLMGSTHPFYVLRLAEIRSWIEAGEYDRIMRGEYQRRDEKDEAYQADLKSAASSYAEGAKELFGSVTGAAKRMADDLMSSMKR
jgi:Zn-dependent protease with chaperone function